MIGTSRRNASGLEHQHDDDPDRDQDRGRGAEKQRPLDDDRRSAASRQRGDMGAVALRLRRCSSVTWLWLSVPLYIEPVLRAVNRSARALYSLAWQRNVADFAARAPRPCRGRSRRSCLTSGRSSALTLG